jgi:hypothetical protein
MHLLALSAAIGILLLACGPAMAQDGDEAAADERDPNLVHWQWSAALKVVSQGNSPYLALTVPLAVFDKSQDDLRDVRLSDAGKNRVPYVLKVFSPKAQQTTLREAREPFNAGPRPKSRTYEMSLELAEVPAPGYNEIEILTTGRNYRRQVEVFGDKSEKFDDPQQFFDKKTYLVLYDVEGRTVDLHRFRFDLKQFRFVLVRVHADGDEEIPRITGVKVRRTITEPGEFATVDANLGNYETTRGDGGPASAWMINLPDKMPCEKLTFEVGGPPSDRPFNLQIANPNENRMPIGGADWRWRKDGERQLLEVHFNEVIARRLRLVVTDFANEPLQLHDVKATYSVRKLIFAKPDGVKVKLPITLYTGNTKVGNPGYVLEQKLPAILKPAPGVVELEESLAPNPAYQPPPPSLNERMPWLVYVVLGLACAVLLAILAALARQAIRRHDAKNTIEPVVQ